MAAARTAAAAEPKKKIVAVIAPIVPAYAAGNRQIHAFVIFDDGSKEAWVWDGANLGPIADE